MAKSFVPCRNFKVYDEDDGILLSELNRSSEKIDEPSSNKQMKETNYADRLHKEFYQGVLKASSGTFSRHFRNILKSSYPIYVYAFKFQFGKDGIAESEKRRQSILRGNETFKL